MNFVVIDFGGHCSPTVNKNTNFLIMGDQDFKLFKDGLKSNKLKKAETLIAKGIDIEIINEEEFLKRI